MAYLKWGFSSAGRAPVLHAGGQGFDPPKLHHPFGHGIVAWIQT